MNIRLTLVQSRARSATHNRSVNTFSYNGDNLECAVHSFIMFDVCFFHRFFLLCLSRNHLILLFFAARYVMQIARVNNAY